MTSNLNAKPLSYNFENVFRFVELENTWNENSSRRRKKRKINRYNYTGLTTTRRPTKNGSTYFGVHLHECGQSETFVIGIVTLLCVVLQQILSLNKHDIRAILGKPMTRHLWRCLHVSRSTYFPSATLGYRKQRGHPGMRAYPDIMEAQIANVCLPTITLQLIAFLTAAACIQFYSESHGINDATLTKIYSLARSTCMLNVMTKLLLHLRSRFRNPRVTLPTSAGLIA